MHWDPDTFRVLSRRLRQAESPPTRNKRKKFVICFTIWKNFFYVPRRAWQDISKLRAFPTHFSKAFTNLTSVDNNWPIAPKFYDLRTFPNLLIIQLLFNLSTFGPKRDEGTEEWRKLHNKELLGLYSSPNIVRVIKSGRVKQVGHVARMGDSTDTYSVLMGQPEGKRPLGYY